MAKFIEVTIGESKILINTSIIESVRKNCNGKAEIDAVFATQGSCLMVQESYEQVRQMLIGGNEDG